MFASKSLYRNKREYEFTRPVDDKYNHQKKLKWLYDLHSFYNRKIIH